MVFMEAAMMAQTKPAHIERTAVVVMVALDPTLADATIILFALSASELPRSDRIGDGGTRPFLVSASNHFGSIPLNGLPPVVTLPGTG